MKPDGSTVINVYYDRQTFKITFKDYYGNNTLAEIRARWGENIKDKFQNICKTQGTYNWIVKQDGTSTTYCSYIAYMPAENRTYRKGDGGTGGVATSLTQDLDNTTHYTEYWTVETGDGYTVSLEDYETIEGFTINRNKSTSIGGSYSGAKFYYDRNKYQLKFFNPEDEVDSKDVFYEENLGKYNFTLTEAQAPQKYEPGSVEFAGWYLNPECTGEPADLNTMTMPAASENGAVALSLYAKWQYVKHTVTTYLTEDAVEKDPPLKTESVKHNEFATAPTDVDNGNYEFVGWFYKDNGVEKAFDFENMPVKKDLTIYGKWRANSMVDFVIHYRLENGTPVAEDRVGKALAESTQTFDAKIGNDLSQGYREGYFPKVASHSMFMNIAGTNEYTFVYVKLPSVNYTVKYLEKGTNNVLKEEKHASTSSAVITERFERIPGYRPDAYQKRLVLSADESENVLIFYYTKDNEHADVTVTHYIQNLDGSYSVYRSTTDLNGVINNPYEANELDIPGFRFEKSTVNGVAKTPTDGKLTATLTKEGLTFEFYYVRNKYPYTFKFLEQDTNKELAQKVTGTELYGKDVTQNSLNIPGYTCVSGDVQRITIDVGVNEAIFYYTEQEVTINYVVEPKSTNMGSLDNAKDEGVKVITGKVQGSTPAPASANYKFEGWYLDEACTRKVPATWVDSNNKLTPQKNAEGLYEAATYYAKFELNVFDLTITKSGTAAIDENQSFIFEVTGPNGYTNTVTIQGDDSVTIQDLTVGEYTVTEKTSWSWRYQPDGPHTITADNIQNGAASVTVENIRTLGQWLNGCSYAINRWINNVVLKSH